MAAVAYLSRLTFMSGAHMRLDWKIVTWVRAATLEQSEEPPCWTREDQTDGAPEL